MSDVKVRKPVNKDKYKASKEEKGANYYFTSGTEAAIQDYNELALDINQMIIDYHDLGPVPEDDHPKDVVEEAEKLSQELIDQMPKEQQAKIEWLEKKKNLIYKKGINDAFKKLVESIFNKFKFSYFDVPYEDVQQRVVHHLVEKIHMYKESKGKAFSYFSMIARNKLIQINNKNYDRYKEEVRIDNDETEFDLPMEETFEDAIQRDEFFQEMVDYWRGRISQMFNKDRDIRIANALLQLFEKRKRIETFNKKGLYVMIREMTGVERTQHITKVVKKFRKEYKDLVENYRLTGTIKPDNKFFET
jgi:DNA-directed RNA polymerase specialized sigma24 family protein